MSHTMKGNQGQGMPDGILKQRGNTMSGNRPRSDMQTIKERETHYDDESLYSEYKENNDINVFDQSNATLSMSLKDPNRPPKVIKGLADFLLLEYEKKFGVRTENPKDLLQFWRNFVSIQHIQERNAKRSNFDGDSIGLQAGGFSLLGGGSPKKYNSMANPKYKSKASLGKSAATTEIHAHLEDYKKYGNGTKDLQVFELDVMQSCEKTLNDRAEKRVQEDVADAQAMQKRESIAKKKAQRKKIQDMIDTYFDVKKILLIQEKIRAKPKPAAPKGGKSFQESRSKSPAAKKPVDKGQSNEKAKPQDKQIEKPSYSIRPQTAKANKEKSLDLKQDVNQPKSKLTKDIEKFSAKLNDDAALRQINALIEAQKQPIWTIMKINHDVQFRKYSEYIDRCNRVRRQEEEFLKQKMEWKKKNPGKEYNETLEVGKKEKPPFALLQDIESIFKEYIQNKDSLKDGKRLYDDIPGGPTKVQSELVEFFKPENIVRRILYYRDHINKSERRGQITLHSFFLNTIPEDQQLYLFYVFPQQVKNDEGKVVTVSSDDVAKQYIAAFQYEQDVKAQIQHEKIVKKHVEKEKKYEVQVMKQVFGEKWTPQDGIKTSFDKFKQDKENPKIKEEAYYTHIAKPKDKWKVGRQLKQLAQEFPHDRVIQRMVQEEFKTNQPFMYPEEYDVFDQGQEKQIKNVFANKGEKGLQSAPDFEKDQGKWDNFNSADAPQYNGTKYQKKQEARAEYKLEMQLQDLAKSYHQLMKKRGAGGKKPETLRSLLAHYYGQIVQVHGKVAQRRFPHVAYGQDPKSETFKKSYPQSFKMYFFKLVKSIIVTVKNKQQTVTYCKKPGSMIMSVGARQSKLEDPVGVRTFNTRLKPFSLKMGIGSHMKYEPKAWRARAWRRNDKREAMKAIFMQQSEIENCTFEPTVQTMLRDGGNNIKPEAPIGEFFSDKRQGKNFTIANPKLFKKGILKRARADMKQGTKPFNVILSNLGGAFNLLSVMQYYRSTDTKVWEKGISAKASLQKAKDNTKMISKYGKSSNDAMNKINQPPSSSPQKPQTQAKDLSKERDNLVSNYSLNKTAEKYDMPVDTIKDINEAFKLYAKKDQLAVRPDLDNAMRKLGHQPGEIELNEIRNQLDAKKEQEMRDVKYANKKQQDEDRISGKKRDEILCKIKGIDLDWFTLIMKDKMAALTTQNELREAFKTLDSIGQQDGDIDAKEFEAVLMSLDVDFSEKEIKDMIDAADTDKDGSISEAEFIKVMTSAGGKGQDQQLMQKMRLNLKRYLNNAQNTKQYEQMKPEIKWILNTIKKQNDNYQQQNRKPKPAEDISEANKSVMDDVWELLQFIINEQKNKFDKKKMYEKQAKKLDEQITGYNEQKLGGYQREDKGEDGKDDDDDDKDFLKIFKTMMCPLGNRCANRRKQRWPYTSLKNTKKLGFKCPFAHHAMELNFPQTLGVRNKVNARLLEKATAKPDDMAEEGAARVEEFKYSGDLKDSPSYVGCGRCSFSQYQTLAKESTEKITMMKTSMAISEDRVIEKVDQNKKDTNLFAQKFGILKKASVLMFYGRPNDCFDALIPAIKIIQEQQKEQNEKNDLIKRKWETKLGCQDLELGKDYRKIRLEDLTEDFLKNETVGKAEMKLLLHKICPLIRDIGDRNVFLNGLIEDLYYDCEDKLKGMQEGIKKIQKNKDKLEEIKEQLEGMGSDAEKEGIKLEDADGNEIKMKKVRRKMCTSVQRRVDYSQKYLSYKAEPEGKKMKDQKVRLEMKTDKKYYCDTTLNKKKKQDANGRSQTIVCEKGKDCKDAHCPIQLDLLPLDKQIKNLKGAIKAQTTLMMNDRPLEPWRPCASDFKVDEQAELAKKKKKKGEKEEEDDDKKKKKRLFERENPFDKPWKADN